MADVSFTNARPASASDYLALLKPRVMSLVVFTGLVGYVAAPGANDLVLKPIEERMLITKTLFQLRLSKLPDTAAIAG